MGSSIQVDSGRTSEQRENPWPRNRWRRLQVAPLAALIATALAAPRPGRAAAPEAKQGKMSFAFVLLSAAKLPSGEAIQRAFPAYALKGQTLRYQPEKPGPSKKGDDQEVILKTEGGQAMVMLLPSPIPKGEADEAARYSVSALDGRWKLPPHKAHLVVTLHVPGDGPERLSLFTSVLAAVAATSPAVGIYWGAAGATHDAKFFREIAKSRASLARLPLWTGISTAREGQRLSLLSLGMKQFDLPDLLLIVPRSQSDDAIPFMFDLLGMVVESGKPLPEGDTVGRTATEKLRVHYVPSPIDPRTQVWRVEMGGR